MIKALLGRLGMWMMENSVLPLTGESIFEWAEEDFARDQFERLVKIFEEIKTSESYSIKKENLKSVRYLRETMEKTLRDKRSLHRVAKKQGIERWNLPARSAYYGKIYKLEQRIFRWLVQRESAIIAWGR